MKTTREIKFRVWDSVTESFVQHNDDNCRSLMICFFGSVFSYDGECRDYRFKLMQYTGLKDKNGKEIYEGDIILGRFILDDVENYTFLTLTDEEKKSQSKKFIVEDIFYPYINPLPDDIEIVGNVYEGLQGKVREQVC